MKRITEKMRLKKGLEMIEEISCDRQSIDPKRDWEKSYDGIIDIYRIIHSLRAPKCRKNHETWCDLINDAIRSDPEYSSKRR